jgi:hypothetical protein
MTIAKNNLDFYQAIGKLFYAVAATDKQVVPEEINAFKKLLKTRWLKADEFKNQNNFEGIKQIYFTFEAFNKLDNPDPGKCFEDFLNFKKSHEDLFKKNLKQLISRTAHAIANSYARKNKSELIILAQLDLELKK